MCSEEKILNFLENNCISYNIIQHPIPVFKVEDMKQYLSEFQPCDAICKNLFLRDKKRKLYLLSTLHDKQINLVEIGRKIKSSGRLTFASENLLFESLGVKPGCATAYALINDTNTSENKVNFILDQDVLKYEKVYFHPMVNTSSVGILMSDFKKFLNITGHELRTVS